jgi:hypothetical protein
VSRGYQSSGTRGESRCPIGKNRSGAIASNARKGARNRLTQFHQACTTLREWLSSSYSFRKIELFFNTAKHCFVSRLDEVPFPHFVVLQYDYFQPLMRHTNGDPQL